MTTSFFVLNSKNKPVIPDNFNGAVFLYRKSEESKVAETQIELFNRLIEKGLKKDVNTFLFIDINQVHERFNSLRKRAAIKQFVLFGVKESEIGINFDIPLHQIKEMDNVAFLKTVAPEVLEKDNSNKAAFWSQLQLILK